MEIANIPNETKYVDCQSTPYQTIDSGMFYKKILSKLNLNINIQFFKCIDQIDKKTTVVILGDARNNFGPEKADLLKSVYERSKQVYWLNPEGKYRWNTGDSVMNTFSAYCTKVFECGTLVQLERVISTLLKTAI